MTDGSVQTNMLGDPEPDPLGLTPRQRLALDYVAANGLVSSDELGAVLHEERMLRGGRGHDRDVRCDYCGDEGADMGRALERRELVRRRRADNRRGLEGGWHLPGWQPAGTSNEGARPEVPDPSTAPFPDGF